MGSSGPHEYLIGVRLRDPYLPVFVVKSDTEQSNNSALSGLSHLFLSVPSCTQRKSLAYFPFFCPIV